MNGDLRQQILVSLRAEGVGEADKARQALAHIEAEMRKASKAFGEGSSTAEEFRKVMGQLGTSFNFFNGIMKESEKETQSVDVGLHKLQLSAVKFGTDYRASMEKSAQATEDLALKEAEAFAKAAQTHEKFLEKEQSDADAAELKETERQAKLAAAYEKFLEREAAAEVVANQKRIASAEAAALKEAERLAQIAAKHEQYLEKQQADEAADELKEIERLARLATAYEKHLEREAAAASKARQKRDADATKFVQKEQKDLDQLLEMGRVVEATAPKYNKLTEAKNKGTEASNKFGYGILHVSHALQDLQYGTGAVLNNIPLMVTAFGGGPGLAGVMMTTAVASQVLSEHIDVDLKQAFTGVIGPTKIFTGTIDGLNEKIKELEKNPMKFGADGMAIGAMTQEVKQLQRAYEAMNAAKEGKTVFEKQSGSEFTQAFEAEGEHGGKVMERVQGQFAGHLLGTSQTLKEQGKIIASIDAQHDELQAKLKEGGDMDTMAGIVFRIHELQGQREAAVAKAGDIRQKIIGPEGEAAGMAGKLLDAAKGGKMTPEARKDFADRLRAAGEDGLARTLEATTPQAMESLDTINEAYDASDDANKVRKRIVQDKRERKRKAETAAKKAETEHEQEVNKAATTYGTPLGQAQGPGSLMDAITARVRKGQSDAEISQGLGGQLGKRLDNNVDADLVNEVADKILMDATAKVRAQATAAGGADTLAGQRQLKFARNEAAEKARTGREAASGYEQSLAQQMFQESGGQLGQQGAMAAAHRAMQNMKEGQSEQQAAWNAMLATIEDLEREAAHARAGMAGVNQRLNRLQAQGRRNRAQKPGLLPFFPQ